MRLSKLEIHNLKAQTLQIDPKAQLSLFGSRTDDSKRGGDIDILIKSNVIRNQDLSKILLCFFEKFGEQKLDIVIDDQQHNQAFIQHIKNHSISL